MEGSVFPGEVAEQQQMRRRARAAQAVLARLHACKPVGLVDYNQTQPAQVSKRWRLYWFTWSLVHPRRIAQVLQRP